MRVQSLLLALLFTLGASLAFAAEPLSAADQVAQMKRGVNIVGYDPIWKDPAKGRFKPRHFKIIKDGGFSTVRINLYGFRQMDDKLALSRRWYATLDGLVGEALKQNLNIVLDEHDYERCTDDTALCRRQLLAFWMQMAEHFRNAPQQVMFEILNEPNRKMDAEWNSLLADALAVIRKTNPTRNVIIGPAFWNNISHLPELKLPESDRHIIVTVHYYEPHTFTHQGASWANMGTTHDIPFPYDPARWSESSSDLGFTPFMESWILSELRKYYQTGNAVALKNRITTAKQWAVDHNVPVI